jgi:arabinose-5-phosphate isomerase
MSSQTIREAGVRTIQLEAESIGHLQQFINEDFVKAVEIISACDGRVVVSGIGKSALVAQKIVATLNSTGTPAMFMHAADAIHGDLGMIQEKDVVIMISKSGESPEIKVLYSFVRNFRNIIIGIAGSDQSFLALQSDIFLNTHVDQEACPNNLAPTSSSTAQIVMGDALAVALMKLRGFNSEDFAKFHPGGSLGKRLYLRVQDLYVRNERPQVRPDSSLKEVIMEMTSKRLGATAVVEPEDRLSGIITDGDLRRMLEKNLDMRAVRARDIMTESPRTIHHDALAAEALELLRRHDVTQLVVTRDGRYAGFIHFHDLIREGII